MSASAAVWTSLFPSKTRLVTCRYISMPSPTAYDPNAPSEQPVPLPSAPLLELASNAVLQPPLTRRGTGPGILVFLPSSDGLKLRTHGNKPLDPEPVQKWAEEGFVVVAVTLASPGWSVRNALGGGIAALLTRPELDTKGSFGVLVYDHERKAEIISGVANDPRVVCVIVYGTNTPELATVPTLLHLISELPKPPPTSLHTFHLYRNSSPHFVLPQAAGYNPGNAALAHTRSVVFLRKWLGGPYFDLEAIWDEHTYFEFEDRSVAKTMGTMVAEPYVNHVPTMTGGIGRRQLTAFYRDHFIFSNPADATLQVVSRTLGPDRVVDEFIYHFTHDKTVDWLLPGVPPSGKKLAIPMLAVVNIRGDRLYNEHIWWDQGTALRQAGILPTYLPSKTSTAEQVLRLPVAGPECADMLLDEANGNSNEMLGNDWGVIQEH